MPEPTPNELRLADLAAHIDWPPTPAVTATVLRRIPRRNTLPPRWLIAAALVAGLAVAVVAATPARDIVAGWLGVHTRLNRVDHLPSPAPKSPGPIGVRLGPGSLSSLEDAGRSAPWLLIPASLGIPDEVYFDRGPAAPPEGEVTLVYGPRAGIAVSGNTGAAVLVTEARGSINSEYFGKMLGPGTTIEAVSVGGRAGYWISGTPHAFYYLDTAGTIRDGTLRLAGNTLLIADGSTVIRIEAEVTRSQALDIGASLHSR